MSLGVHVALNADGFIERLSDPAFKVYLPPSSSISIFWPECQQLVALPQGSQRIVTSRQHATLVALALMQVLLEADIAPHDLSFSDKHLPFIVDSFTALFRDFQQWKTALERTKFQEHAEEAFISLLASILNLSQASIRHCGIPSTKIALFLSCSLSHLLVQCCVAPFSEHSQTQLALLLSQVGLKSFSTSTCGSKARIGARSFESLVMDSLEPTISRICQDTVMFSGLHKDLQVCIVILLTAGY
jgi:serine/threonine-protein kinase ATR